MAYRQTLRDNALWYFSNVTEFGWWIEVLPRLAMLDVGHVKTPEEGEQSSYADYWYVDFRLPLGEWKSLNTSKAFRRRKAVS